MYLTYEEYVGYGGVESEPVFARYCVQAGARIDLLTHNRARALAPVPDVVKIAASEAITILARRASEAAEGRMQSFSNDGMSISLAQESAQERDLALNGAIVNCLWGVMAQDGKTPLLYAGVVT